MSETNKLYPEMPTTPGGTKESTMDTTWMAAGNCANESPSLFFPSDGVGVEIAKRTCTDCPVKTQCLDYALEHRIDHGVWGGTSERERRRILRARGGRRQVPVSTAV
jgi:WhiB family redox-sensing transcriptional regulator